MRNFLFLALLGILVAGYTKGQVTHNEEALWFHIQSPITKRCYEVAYILNSHGISGGGEIPCSEARLTNKR